MSDSKLQLQYANQSMQYTTQFIASISADEVILDCGSVVIPASGADNQQLPIHTRMALPWSAVNRLHRLLGELIQSHQQASAPGSTSARASLPPLLDGQAPADEPTSRPAEPAS